MTGTDGGMHLTLRHIGKSFRGIKALDDINLGVPRGRGKPRFCES
jgi:ABC-type sugar transport system ATPase subunit